MSRGADTGTRWGRAVAASADARRLLAALDRMFESEVWDYRPVFLSLATVGVTSKVELLARWFGASSKTDAEQWWRHIADSDWPADAGDQACFVKGFVIGAALELRGRLSA